MGAYEQQVWPIPGDANLNCSVSITDIIYVRNNLGKDTTLDSVWQADVKWDGRVNILDMVFVRNRIGTSCAE